MASTPIARRWSRLLFAALIAASGSGPGVLAQTAPTGDPMADVRQTLDAARKEIATYKTAGGAPGAADHPAIKWDAELWTFRERYPRSNAATIASTEAVRFLIRAELWDRVRARVDSLDADDPAWERLGSAVYEEGIARKDVPSAIARLSRIAAATRIPQIKSAVLVVVGRGHRRQGDNDAALRTLEQAKAAAPGTSSATEAEGIIYEITHLSVGLPAPPISGTARDGRAVNLESFRGKAVVLVFWGTT